MEPTQEQQLFQQVINEAWENAAFKAELIADPVAAIESLTGQRVNIPEGKTLVVRDQSEDNVVYVNVPASQSTDDVELNEEQLEAVSGGVHGDDGCISDPIGDAIRDALGIFNHKG